MAVAAHGERGPSHRPSGCCDISHVLHKLDAKARAGRRGALAAYTPAALPPALLPAPIWPGAATTAPLAASVAVGTAANSSPPGAPRAGRVLLARHCAHRRLAFSEYRLGQGPGRVFLFQKKLTTRRYEPCERKYSALSFLVIDPRRAVAAGPRPERGGRARRGARCPRAGARRSGALAAASRRTRPTTATDGAGSFVLPFPALVSHRVIDERPGLPAPIPWPCPPPRPPTCA
ncbi:MAG: hypothetical protein WKG07_38745 [Hymenobacter sp.]